MARTVIDKEHKADARRRLARVRRAHGAAGAPDKSKSIAITRAALRTHLPLALKRVFNELAERAPGPECLSIVVAIMAAQAAEEARLLAVLSRTEDADKREGIVAGLQEHRRSTRHLATVSGVICKAVKVYGELHLSNAPNKIEITGTEAARDALTDTDDDEGADG